MGSSVSKQEYAEKVFGECVDTSLYDDLKCKYKYENLVFQGGGAKGVAYAGAVKVLEDTGVLMNITRFAGTSVGALTAMILALGGTAEDVCWETRCDIGNIVEDSWSLAMPLNMIKNLGWHRGHKLQEHIWEIAERLTGNKDITFEELYYMRGVELCVVVTNLSTCTIAYLHPKTTPEMSVAVAVKTSMTLPLLLQPMSYLDPFTKQVEVCVDGGICMNYPINAFDGWYLSLKTADSFFHRIGSGIPQFENISSKTLGIKLFNATDVEANFPLYIGRYGDDLATRPKTSLAKHLGGRTDKYLAKKKELYKVCDSARRFLKLISPCDEDMSGTIDLEEFKKAIQKVALRPKEGDKEPEDESHDQSPKEETEVTTNSSETTENEFTAEDFKNIFGEDASQMTYEELFSKLDENKDQEISYGEFVQFMSKKGATLRNLMTNSQARMEISSVASFINSIMATYDHELERLGAGQNDTERTIAIYTDYIRTRDMKLGTKDKHFLVKQGVVATVAFLKEKVAAEKD